MLNITRILIIVKGGNSEDHLHAPNIEEVNALKVVRSVKRRAEEHSEAPPAQILRTELSKVPTGTTYFNNINKKNLLTLQILIK